MWTQLQVDLFASICYYLKKGDLLSCRIVCSKWKKHFDNHEKFSLIMKNASLKKWEDYLHQQILYSKDWKKYCKQIPFGENEPKSFIYNPKSSAIITVEKEDCPVYYCHPGVIDITYNIESGMIKKKCPNTGKLLGTLTTKPYRYSILLISNDDTTFISFHDGKQWYFSHWPHSTKDLILSPEKTVKGYPSVHIVNNIPLFVYGNGNEFHYPITGETVKFSRPFDPHSKIFSLFGVMMAGISYSNFGNQYLVNILNLHTGKIINLTRVEKMGLCIYQNDKYFLVEFKDGKILHFIRGESSEDFIVLKKTTTKKKIKKWKYRRIEMANEIEMDDSHHHCTPWFRYPFGENFKYVIDKEKLLR